MIIRINEYECIRFRVTSQEPVIVALAEPDLLGRADETFIWALRAEKHGKFRTSPLHLLRWQARHPCCRRAGARIELRDVQYRECIFLHELQRRFEILLRLCREATDDICRYRAVRRSVTYAVNHLLEFCDCVLTMHRLKHHIAAGLHRDVEE